MEDEYWSGAVFHGSGSLVPVKGNLNATAYNDILDVAVHLTLWQKFDLDLLGSPLVDANGNS